MKRRRRLYFILMGICLILFVLAWSVVRFHSTTAAVIMSVIAMFIPPFAAVVGNSRGEDEPWWDE
jgi:hypothetical protein